MPGSLYAPVPIEARMLGYRLGLGDIQFREPCNGHENMCVCDACLQRDEMLAEHGRLSQTRIEIARLRDDWALLDLNEDARGPVAA